MGTPTEFLQNAHDCVELAKHTTNAAHRKLLVNLAVNWVVGSFEWEKSHGMV